MGTAPRLHFRVHDPQLVVDGLDQIRRTAPPVAHGRESRGEHGGFLSRAKLKRDDVIFDVDGRERLLLESRDRIEVLRMILVRILIRPIAMLRILQKASRVKEFF